MSHLPSHALDNLIRVSIDNDENMKILGELFASKSGREMIKMLVGKKMYSNEVGKKMGIDSSMTSHYLKKMEALKILKITNEKIFRRGNKQHRFFQIPSSSIIIDLKPEKDEKRVLKKTLKDGLKFLAIGLAGFVSWKFLPNNNFGLIDDHSTLIDKDPNLILIPFIIIIIGLIIERISVYKKRKN